MQFRLSILDLYNRELKQIKEQRALINTINAHSYNIAQRDKEFQLALQNCDILLPDGIGVVWALRLITGKKIKKIAGSDLFNWEMERLDRTGGKCFFLGSNESTLAKIQKRIQNDFRNVKVKTYAPTYRHTFLPEENARMIHTVNSFAPDVLFIGMTAPKQEKWAYKHYHQLNAGHICSIGAVFDFYAGTVKRAPKFLIDHGLEWSYRLLKEPRRMWRRYLIGIIKFTFYITKEKFFHIYFRKQ
ncbi:MAG: WecB/TagA/CpsF family glycosyltransferase [Bacteroidota bacterium]|nr:WecB/TagA/CpsF family glycosyltransferase [Bacteroidota bacterium]